MKNAKKLYVSETSRLITPYGFPSAKNQTAEYRHLIPCIFFVLEHAEKGPILFDAGADYEHFEKSKLRLFGAPMPRISEQLKLIGHEAEDIKTIVLSHLHFDHVCQLFDYPNADVYVRETEWNSVMNEVKGHTEYEKHIMEWWRRDCPNAELHLIPDDMEYDLFGDGSVIAIKTYGHTLGHQSFLIDLENTGKVLLTMDALHYERELYTDELFAGSHSVEMCRESADRLKRDYIDKGYLTIYGHCPEVFDNLKKLPEYYD